MEVREQRIDRLEPVTWKDQQVGPTLAGVNATVGRDAFQHPYAGRADRYDPVPCGTRRIDRGCGGWIEPVPLAMDCVVGWVINPYRSKGIEANVKREKRGPDPAGSNGRQQLGRKGQAGGRHRRRSLLAGEDRLIPPG